MNPEEISSRTWDVIVVGAGPAGAISALLAARSGASTLLVEKKKFPRVKVCGGCLSAPAVALLEILGLGDITRDFGIPLDGVCLGSRGKRAVLPLPGGVSIARTYLDSELVRHAREDGVTFLPETAALLKQDVDSAREVLLTTHGTSRLARARAVVIASGLGGSSLGGERSFSTRIARGSRIGAGCSVASSPNFYRAGRIAMAVGRSGYVGLSPTIDGLAIASATDPGFLKQVGGPGEAATVILDEAGFPPIPSLRDAAWSGTLPLTQSTRPVALSRVFLVGDAAGYVEPFTGQGMAIAIQGAVALSPLVAQAIRAWDPAIARTWAREYSRNVGSRHWPARFCAAIARRPLVAGVALSLASSLPSLPAVVVKAVNRPLTVPLSP